MLGKGCVVLLVAFLIAIGSIAGVQADEQRDGSPQAATEQSENEVPAGTSDDADDAARDQDKARSTHDTTSAQPSRETTPEDAEPAADAPETNDTAADSQAAARQADEHGEESSEDLEERQKETLQETSQESTQSVDEAEGAAEEAEGTAKEAEGTAEETIEETMEEGGRATGDAMQQSENASLQTGQQDTDHDDDTDDQPPQEGADNETADGDDPQQNATRQLPAATNTVCAIVGETCTTASDALHGKLPAGLLLEIAVPQTVHVDGLPEQENAEFTAPANEPAPQQVAVPQEQTTATSTKAMMAMAAVATVAVAAAVATTTSAGNAFLASLARWLAAFKGLLLAQYARLAKSKVLDHKTRQELHLYLQARPGACITEIQQELGTTLSTTRHHLSVLQQHGLVVNVKNGRRRCFFATDDGLCARDRTRTAALSSQAVRRVWDTIRQHPGIRQKDLAELLGVSRTSVIFHIRRLQEAGVVRQQQNGREAVYHAEEAPVAA